MSKSISLGIDFGSKTIGIALAQNDDGVITPPIRWNYNLRSGSVKKETRSTCPTPQVASNSENQA